MSKRVKVIVSVVVAIVLLTIGIVVPVMAEDETPTPERSELRESFLTRLADNLDISVDELKAAIAATQQEMREQALIRALDRAVEKERITGEEAEAIKAWWGERPTEVLDLCPFGRAFGAPGLRCGHMWGGPRGRHWPMPPEPAD